MNRDTIKMLAMATMLVNHIANVFMPAGAPLTNLCLYIGYFTAVTMCYFLVEGYGYTHSNTHYAGRLFGFAVLAQLPYQLVFPEHGMAGMLRSALMAGSGAGQTGTPVRRAVRPAPTHHPSRRNPTQPDAAKHASAGWLCRSSCPLRVALLHGPVLAPRARTRH